MTVRKTAGIALVVCACAGVAWWVGSAPRVPSWAATPLLQSMRPARTEVQVPVDASLRSPRPFAFDAVTARAAVREGVLYVVAPDGAPYPVRIERQFTDGTGHWNVIGRADTRLGPQPMVLTFGPNAVFGTLPLPDGSSMRIVTGRGGVVTIAPAGSLVPEGVVDAGRVNDVMQPSMPAAPESPDRHVVVPTSTASQRVRLASPGATDPPPTAIASAPMPLAADPTPVQVDVLALYGADQVALRGSVAAVETEFANLFAVANQAHIDSGSRVRFRAVRVAQAGTVSTTHANPDVLTALHDDGVIADARNAVGADLVTILRPYHAGDSTCGIAYLPGAAQWRTRTMSDFAFSVVNDDETCGPLVMAHELGHNLGSMHDRQTDTHGVATHGAWWFSFGRRTDGYEVGIATIMAYPEYRTWVPYFSNPMSNKCGVACGIADDADNVRSFNLMAPHIASYRGTPGTISVSDTEALEPKYSEVYSAFEVRLTGRAPVGGVQLRVDQVGGLATEGADYRMPNGNTVVIPEGSSTATVFVLLLPDTVDEGDERIVFRVSSSTPGVVIADADAEFTIVRPVQVHLAGKLWFPPDVAVPTTQIRMTAENADGANSAFEYVLSPPDYAYALDVPYAAQVRLTPKLPDPLVVHRPLVINEARDSRTWYLFPERGVRVTGALRADAGMVMPLAPFQILMYQRADLSSDDWPATVDYINIDPANPTFSRLVPRGSQYTIVYDNNDPTPGNSVPFARTMVSTWGIRADTHHDIVLSAKPSLRPIYQTRSPQFIGGLILHLSERAPPGGVTFRCRVVDGTAKAGRDFTFAPVTVTVPEGGGEAYCGDFVTTPGDSPYPLTATLVVDQVQGAILTTPTAPINVLRTYSDHWMRTGGRNPPRTP